MARGGEADLLDHGCRNAGLTGFFLHAGEFLFGVVQSFLLVGDFLLVVRVLLVPLAFVAHAVARVGIHGGGAELIFALRYVKLPRRQVDLIFLRAQLILPGVVRGLFLGLLLI